jgi:acyl-CoA synthetase (NDP forming)
MMLEKILQEAGIPVYEGLQRAVFALAKLAEYHEFQRKQTDDKKKRCAEKKC